MANIMSVQHWNNIDIYRNVCYTYRYKYRAVWYDKTCIFMLMPASGKRCLILIMMTAFCSGMALQAQKIPDTLTYDRIVWSVIQDTGLGTMPLPMRLVTMADRFRHEGNNDLALHYLFAAVAYNILTHQYLHIIYNRIANVYQTLDNPEAALGFYFRAMDHIHSPLERAQLQVNIADCISQIRDYDRALMYINSALYEFEQSHNRLWQVIAYGSKASVYNDMGDYTNAVRYYKTSYAISTELPIDTAHLSLHDRDVLKMRGIVLNNLTEVFLKIRQPDSALYYIGISDSIFNVLPSYVKVGIIISKGEVYNRYGDHAQSLFSLKKGLKMAESSGYKSLQGRAHLALSHVYSNLGMYSDALAHLYKHTEQEEQSARDKEIHRINALRTNYELAQKDKEIERKEKEIAIREGRIKEKNLWTAILGLGLCFITTASVFYRKNYLSRKRLLEEKLKNAEIAQKTLRIQARLEGEERERTRIARELHNGVASEVLALKFTLRVLEKKVDGLHGTEIYRDALKHTEEIAAKLRETAHNLLPGRIGEIGLYRSIEAWLDRLKTPGIQFHFLHYGETPPISEEEGKVIFHITLELIQNIIKHADATEAVLQFHYFDEALHITIEDNGIGISDEHMNGAGIGLKDIRQQIQLLQGKINIKGSRESGTTILIEIPLLNEHYVQQR